MFSVNNHFGLKSPGKVVVLKTDQITTSVKMEQWWSTQHWEINYISVHPWYLQINLYKAGASQSKILPLSLLKDISLIQSIVAMAFLRIKQWQQYFRLITTFYSFIVVFTTILSYLVSLLSTVTNAISMRKDQQSKKKISNIFKTQTILQELAKIL